MFKALFAQYDYSYDAPLYTDTSGSDGATGFLAGFFIFLLLIFLAVAVVAIVATWKLFVKAGKPGWAALVPIYNTIILLEIVGRPMAWIGFFVAAIVLSPIPFINMIAGLGIAVLSVFISIDLAKSFGRTQEFGLVTGIISALFFPFLLPILILGFGKDKYKGPAIQPVGVPATAAHVPAHKAAKEEPKDSDEVADKQ